MSNEFFVLLGTGLTEGFGVGLSGGDASTIGLVSLQREADKQSLFALGFITDFRRDLTNGVNAGIAPSEIASALSGFVARAALYAGAYWVATWLGLGDMLRGETFPRKVRRVLDPQAQHCNTCPGKAGIYDSFDDMFVRTGGLPADGSDQCGPNCRCWIEVETQSGSGTFIRWNGEPTTFESPIVRVPVFGF